jgi:hypothetical protein
MAAKAKPKPKTETRYRSAVTGEWVKPQYAKTHKTTTVRVTIKKP